MSQYKLFLLINCLSHVFYHNYGGQQTHLISFIKGERRKKLLIFSQYIQVVLVGVKLESKVAVLASSEAV
jgi:hypothetical protein